MDEPPGLAEWAIATVPEAMRQDPIWRLPAYRYSLYLGDQLQAAAGQIRRVCTPRMVDQLVDAAQSISANIAERYGRTSGRERAKFFELRKQFRSGNWRMAIQGARRVRSGYCSRLRRARNTHNADSDGRYPERTCEAHHAGTIAGPCLEETRPSAQRSIMSHHGGS
jgi:hypothetical protein